LKKYGYNRELDSSFEDYSKNIIGIRGQSEYDRTRGIRGMYDNRCIGIEIPLWDKPHPWQYTSSDIPYDEVGFTMGESRINVPLQPDSYASIIDSIEEMVEPFKFMPY